MARFFLMRDAKTNREFLLSEDEMRLVRPVAGQPPTCNVWLCGKGIISVAHSFSAIQNAINSRERGGIVRVMETGAETDG